MELLQEIKVLNQPALCPWTSSAPLQSATTMKLASFTDSNKTCNNTPNSANATLTIENSKSNKGDEKTSKNVEKDDEFPRPEHSKSEALNVKQSSSQFFHFLRLMQLFPNVHPATLHTVMTLCKNDFFVVVDKLLYARRCKELYQNRRNLFQNFTSKNQRFSPYPCNTAYCQNAGCIKPHVIKLDAKKMVSRNRYSKAVADEQECTPMNPPDLVPVSLQCNVPIRPLSPVTPKDLSSTTNTATESICLQK